MKIRGAVLTAAGAEQPYATSQPLGIHELHIDDPRPSEVLVRVEAAGVCHSDLSVVNGDRVRPLPMLLGHEAAGVVEAVGSEVSDLKPGDHVVMAYVPSCGECPFCLADQPALCTPGAAANGAGELLAGGRRLSDAAGQPVNHHLGVSGFSDYAVIDRSSLVRVDDDIPFDVAALFGCAMSTGFGAVTRTAGVQAGDTVVVIGLGGVGLSAVMAAAAVGASVIVAVDPVEQKRERAREMGATHIATPDDAAQMVADVTGGARWVFEAVGSAAVLAQAVALTGRGGTTVAIGLPHPSATLTIPALPIVAESKTITGSYMGSTRPQIDIPAMIDLWRDGNLPVERLISGYRPLHEINEALDELASGAAIRQIITPQR
ncbi:zinc-binding dehydrogenase [Salinibacterium sp. ZJ450]|uniref:zinc-binding dehydrogenase n=1 Tax=Salinibacterium sp. ZJ450 TaxID=2708338 RepID=UPI00141F055E|nr:zinc-binding dehydrogenase [Salinibacterium sp. ZJ450]